MTLKIKGKEEKDIIELERYANFISVEINGEMMASFCDDGNFLFWGNKADKEFEGRWK